MSLRLVLKEYPKQLCELHNDYSLAPDKIKVKRKMLSEYQLRTADHYKIPIGNVKKLVPNLFDKEKYRIHYENLKLYLRLRLKLTKIHRVLEFNKSQWLKPDIELNTRKDTGKKQKKDKNEKAMYKLMNNALYQKTMENLTNRINMQLLNNEKNSLKCTSKTRYMPRKIFGNNFAAICKCKLTLKPNEHAYIEMCLLELSKVLLYKFHYQKYKLSKNKYDNK